MTTLDEIQARADAATEGPWEAVDAFDENGEDWLYSEIRHTYRADGIVWPNQILGTTDLDEADAEFISHAREDVPKLVAALRAVEAVHRNEHRDKNGRKSETPTDRGGFCYHCGWYGGDACPMITTVREALG